MNIAVIGAGNVGKGLATGFTRAGHNAQRRLAVGLEARRGASYRPMASGSR